VFQPIGPYFLLSLTAAWKTVRAKNKGFHISDLLDELKSSLSYFEFCT
jgi:hypothetical protein